MRKLIGLALFACLFATPAIAKAHIPSGKAVHKIYQKKAVRYHRAYKPRLVASKKPIEVASLGWPMGLKFPAYDWSRVSLPAFPSLFQGDPVDDYLCGVYNRMPAKIDGSGDFTWKDQAAAKKSKMDVCEYAIGGMNSSFKKSLYAFGQKADEENIPWSFLSGYRGEYRQRIAAGFKAGPCGSWHGGRQCQERGFGEGRAADLWTYDPDDGRPARSAFPLFALIDKIGKQFNIFRPMKGGDPAHVQLIRMYDEKPSSYAVVRHYRYKQGYASKASDVHVSRKRRNLDKFF